MTFLTISTIVLAVLAAFVAASIMRLMGKAYDEKEPSRAFEITIIVALVVILIVNIINGIILTVLSCNS